MSNSPGVDRRPVERRRSQSTARDAGSGTVLLLGVAAIALGLLIAVAGLGAAALARHRAETAADLAALAAASAQPADCAAAQEIAAANDGTLRACQDLTDGSVQVRVSAALAGGWARLGSATATARAGQPRGLAP